MLCSRPNESPGPMKKEYIYEGFSIFCARVVPADQLGLVPTKKYDEIKVRKRKMFTNLGKNPVLNKHRAWLEQFKARVAADKLEEE